MLGDGNTRVVLEVDETPATQALDRASKSLGDFGKQGETTTTNVASGLKVVSQQFSNADRRALEAAQKVDFFREKYERFNTGLRNKGLENLGKQLQAAREAADPRQIERFSAALERAKNAAAKADLAKDLRQARDAARQAAAEVQKLDNQKLAFGQNIRTAIIDPLAAAKQAASSFLETFGSMGLVAAGVTTAIGIGAVKLLQWTREAGAAAEQTLNFADRLDLSIEQAEKLRAITDIAGVSLSSFEGAAVKLGDALTDSSGAGRAAAKVLFDLDISTKAAAGGQRAMGAITIDLIEKLSGLTDHAKRVAFANDTIGKGAKELLPLIKNYRELAEQVERLGLALDRATILRLVAADKQFDVLDKRREIAKAQLSASGGLYLVTEMTENLERFVKWVDMSTMKFRFLLSVITGEKFNPRVPVEIPGTKGLLSMEASGRAAPPPDEAALKRIADAEKKSSEIFLKARIGERVGIGKLEAQRFEQLRDFGFSEKARVDIGASFLLNFLRERADITRKANAAAMEEANKNIGVLNSAANAVRDKAFREEQSLQQRALELQGETIEKRFAAETAILERIRDQELSQLDFIDTRTIQGKLYVEQQRLGITREYLQKLAFEEIAAIDRRTRAEVAAEEAVGRMKLARKEITKEGLWQIINDINLKGVDDARQVAERMGSEIVGATTKAQTSQARIVFDAQQQLFDRFKQGSERVFDALLDKSTSVWEAMGNTLKNAILTALREVVSSAVARSLVGLFSVGGGGPAFAGGGNISRGAGLLGLLGGIGGGFNPAFGIGPDGTAPLSGAANSNVVGVPGMLGVMMDRATGQIGMVGAGGASRFAGLGALFGIGGGSAFGGGAAGAAASSLTSPAGILAGIGLFSAGLKQSGQDGLGHKFAGLGLSTGGGFLAGAGIGFMVGGPFGAAIGAAIGTGVGAITGLIGFFRTSIEKRVIDMVMSSYHVKIDKSLARAIAQIAQQNFGGHLASAIGSRPVAEMIQLFAMMSGQKYGGALTSPQALSLAASGGGLFEVGGGSGFRTQTSFPSLGGGAPAASSGGPQTIVLQIDGQATTQLLQGTAVAVTAQYIQQNPGRVSKAANRGYDASHGRREAMRLLLNPGAVVTS